MALRGKAARAWASAALGVLGALGALGCLQPAPADVLSQDALFSPDRVWYVDIALTEEAMDQLREEPREYVPGRVTIHGMTLPSVGVRLKGTFSFRPLGGKAAFKLSFDHFRPEQRFIGLEGLTLNNLIQDRALVHEQLAYALFRAVGVPAPRTGYARVHVNGELYGLYAMVESIDDEFLAQHYDDPTGSLYEEYRFSDLTPEDVSMFEQDEGADTSRQDLMRLVEAVGEPGDGVFTSGLLDTREFAAFVATEIAVGHWDGYHKAHNYRVYHEPAADRWTFLPWGADQTLERRLEPFSGDGVVTEKCRREPVCLAELAAAGIEVAEAMESLALADEVQTLAAVIDEAAQADPKRPYPIAKYARHQREVEVFLRERPAAMLPRVDCVEAGAEADRDGDGYGGCLADCDDRDADVNPGAAEVCDGRDNDCDGYADELTTCECPAVQIEGVEFLLCDNPVWWLRASAICRAQDAELAWLDSPAQSRRVHAVAQTRRPGHWYIGLHDRGAEGEFAWASGQDVAFDGWAEGEPDDFGGEDCAVLDRFASGGWSDVRCLTALPFVCRRSE